MRAFAITLRPDERLSERCDSLSRFTRPYSRTPTATSHIGVAAKVGECGPAGRDPATARGVITITGGVTRLRYVLSRLADLLGQRRNMETNQMVPHESTAARTGGRTFGYAGYSLGSLLMALGALAVMIATLTYGQ